MFSLRCRQSDFVVTANRAGVIDNDGKIATVIVDTSDKLPQTLLTLE